MINVLSDNSRSKIFTEADKPAAKDSAETAEPRKGKKKAAGTTPRKRITKFEQVECPLCGKGHIIKGKTAFGCSEYAAGCTLRLFFNEYPETLTPSKLKKKMESDKVGKAGQ